MSVSLTVNGVTYAYPQLNDEGWAADVTGWATAVTAGMLQKAGGSFTLTADVNFGATYGLIVEYLKSNTANVSSSGEIRLANTDVIAFRNAANSANLELSINPANDHLIFDGVDLSASSSSGNVIGPVSSTDNAMARFDGITGQLLQNSGVLLDDSNNMSGVTSVTLDNGATDGGRVNFNGGSSSYVGSSADGATLQIAGFTAASVPAGVSNSIQAARTTTVTTNGTDPGIGGVCISAGSGTSATSSATYSNVTNLSCTITTSGRPVMIMLTSDGPSSSGYVGTTASSSSSSGNIRFRRDSTDIATFPFINVISGATSVGVWNPGSMISFVDTPAAGTYTYVTRFNASSSTTAVNNCKMLVYEL